MPFGVFGHMSKHTRVVTLHMSMEHCVPSKGVNQINCRNGLNMSIHYHTNVLNRKVDHNHSCRI